MKIAPFFVVAASSVQASGACEEIPKCTEPHLAWDEHCFTSQSHGFTNSEGGRTYFTQMEYPLFATTDRFRTNSAVFAVLNDAVGQFEWRETDLDSKCEEGQESFCWTMIQRGRFDYKFTRGVDFRTSNLEMVSISFRNTFDADDDPVEVVAEKMFICDADVHNLPEPEPPVKECCDTVYWKTGVDVDGDDVWRRWRKTEDSREGHPIYSSEGGDFLWWMYHGDSGHWVANQTPGSHGDDKVTSGLGESKCPDEVTDWSDDTNTMSCTPPPPPKIECCDTINWHNGQGNAPATVWRKTGDENEDHPIYSDGENFMWWMWHDNVGHWVINKTPGSHGDDVLKSNLDGDKCPNEVSSSDWSDGQSTMRCNKCDKRLRPCEAWEDPMNTDCYVWETSSENAPSYRGTLTYPFLGQTAYYQANKSVWVNFVDRFSKESLTVESACEQNQNEFCWLKNKNGPAFFQFTRGQDAFKSKLDFVGITMHHTFSQNKLGHVWPLDAVYICDAVNFSPPEVTLPLPPATEPPVCDLDKIDDVKSMVNADDLIAGGMKKGKANRIARFWSTQIIQKFKDLYGRSQYDSCKYDGDFKCHEMAPKSSSHRDMYDWAINLGVERLGACGGIRQFERKLKKWARDVNLAAPTLEPEDCPPRCDHDEFHKYIIPRIDVAIEQDEEKFTKQSHKNKFKYMYIKYMSIIQNEYRKSEECRASVGSNGSFDCLTVCLAQSPSELMSFYFARMGDSVMGRDGCENTETTKPGRQPAIMKQMNGLNNWLCQIGTAPNCNQRSNDFWLPKWANDL